MDPNETFRSIVEAIVDKDYQDTLDHVRNLQEWLDRSGLPPTEWLEPFLRAWLEHTRIWAEAALSD